MLGRVALALLWLAALVGVTGAAYAQTASSSGSSSGGSVTSATESISSPVANPHRLLLENTGYVDVTDSPRPQNLNPNGVNFTDCLQDLRLDFSLVITGFNPGDADHIEVWAGTVDCTQDANRSAVNAGVAQPCWQVAGKTAAINATSTDALGITVYSRDVLRYEQPPQEGTNDVYDPTYHNSSSGPNACKVQLSDAAVPLTIYFLPVNSASQAQGTAYAYAITTDLVAPPAPTIDSVAAGDELVSITWTSPGSDPDIAGFAIYSDPPAGGSTTGGCSCGGSPGSGANSYVGDGAVALEDATMLRCIDSSTGDEGEDDGGDAMMSSLDGSDSMTPTDGALESSTDGAPEASFEASTGMIRVGEGVHFDTIGDGGTVSFDAGDAAAMNCGPINHGGGDAGACNSLALTGNVYVVGTSSSSTEDGGDAAIVEPVSEDGGSDAGVALTGGGISSIPTQYKAGEIDDLAATSLTLTGLVNGHSYTVVVTCIDGSGNVGPVSTPQCKTPAPTNDFWGTYKSDKGAATGCALGGGAGAPAFAVGMLAVAAAMARRRRR